MSETAGPWVVDATDENFEQAVLEASKERPVVVDFWAEWCQPCLMLKPVLEGLAKEFGGKFLLARAKTDDVPQFAQQFQVEGIPAVFMSTQSDRPYDSTSSWGFLNYQAIHDPRTIINLVALGGQGGQIDQIGIVENHWAVNEAGQAYQVVKGA